MLKGTKKMRKLYFAPTQFFSVNLSDVDDVTDSSFTLGQCETLDLQLVSLDMFPYFESIPVSGDNVS